MAIIYTCLQTVEKTHEKFDKAKNITKARVKDLTITVAAWIGCIDEKGGAEFKEFGSRAPRVKGTMKIKVVAPAEVLCTDQETEIAHHQCQCRAVPLSGSIVPRVWSS